MINSHPFLWTDAYKLHHPHMFPSNMVRAVNNMTARKSRIAGIDYVVMAGLEAFVNGELHYFLHRASSDLPIYYRRALKSAGLKTFDQYFEKMMLEGNAGNMVFRALEEGTFCPIGVPFLLYYNEEEEGFFLPSYLETLISLCLWRPITSATLASQFKIEAVMAHMRTHDSTFDEAWEATMWQCHDFSMRGMDSLQTVETSSAAHLLFFNGTDSLPAFPYLVNNYGLKIGTDIPEDHNVPATEHAVMCAGTKEGELETFRRLLDLYPEGIVSIVSDTWDLWHVITDTLVRLKMEIMARNGKVVIRPDSGDPVDILCGLNSGNTGLNINTTFKEVSQSHPNYVRDYVNSESEWKGVVELLWDIFGGTVNEAGYKVLDPHIGVIYGDSITLEREKEIFARLEAKGFASSNVVLGIGSYTYTYNTRDTFGMAVKATYVEVREGEEVVGREIFKDPITDDGTKKSAKGLLMVKEEENQLVLKEGVSWDDVRSANNKLTLLYNHKDSFTRHTPFSKIRENVKENCRRIVTAKLEAQRTVRV